MFCILSKYSVVSVITLPKSAQKVDSTYWTIEPTGIWDEFYSYQVHEIFSRRLERYPIKKKHFHNNIKDVPHAVVLWCKQIVRIFATFPPGFVQVSSFLPSRRFHVSGCCGYSWSTACETTCVSTKASRAQPASMVLTLWARYCKLFPRNNNRNLGLEIFVQMRCIHHVKTSPVTAYKEPPSAKHEENFSVKIDSSRTWTRTFGIPVHGSTYWAIEETGIGGLFYPYQVHEIFSRRLERYPSEDVQCFDSITEPSSEKHEEKISNMISYTAQAKFKSWLECDLNAIQARMWSVSILLQNHPQRNAMQETISNMISYTAEVNSKSWSERDFSAIQVRMCDVSVDSITDPSRRETRRDHF